MREVVRGSDWERTGSDDLSFGSKTCSLELPRKVPFEGYVYCKVSIGFDRVKSSQMILFLCGKTSFLSYRAIEKEVVKIPLLPRIGPARMNALALFAAKSTLGKSSFCSPHTVTHTLGLSACG